MIKEQKLCGKCFLCPVYRQWLLRSVIRVRLVSSVLLCRQMSVAWPGSDSGSNHTHTHTWHIYIALTNSTHTHYLSASPAARTSLCYAVLLCWRGGGARLERGTVAAKLSFLFLVMEKCSYVFHVFVFVWNSFLYMMQLFTWLRRQPLYATSAWLVGLLLCQLYVTAAAVGTHVIMKSLLLANFHHQRDQWDTSSLVTSRNRVIVFSYSKICLL